jgi:hypothetical protein
MVMVDKNYAARTYANGRYFYGLSQDDEAEADPHAKTADTWGDRGRSAAFRERVKAELLRTGNMDGQHIATRDPKKMGIKVDDADIAKRYDQLMKGL